MSGPLSDLTDADCRDLLAGGVLGRVGDCGADGPVVVPVNYSVLEDAILFRTEPDGLLGRGPWPRRLAFEVDHLEYAEQRGWSVLAVGQAQIVPGSEIRRLHGVWLPRPWALGPRTLHVRLTWERLSGRRLGSGWTRDDELPVRRQVGPSVPSSPRLSSWATRDE